MGLGLLQRACRPMQFVLWHAVKQHKGSLESEALEPKAFV